MDSCWLLVVFMLTCSPYQDVGVAAAVVTEEDKLRAMIEDETDKNQQARCVYLNCVCGGVYVGVHRYTVYLDSIHCACIFIRNVAKIINLCTYICI